VPTARPRRGQESNPTRKGPREQHFSYISAEFIIMLSKFDYKINFPIF
jgi:hypothetical protein